MLFFRTHPRGAAIYYGIPSIRTGLGNSAIADDKRMVDATERAHEIAQNPNVSLALINKGAHRSRCDYSRGMDGFRKGNLSDSGL